jgi:fluoroquinolone transport system permease protein
MKQLMHLMKFDFMLLNKNKIITVSVVVTMVYVIIFKGLSQMGNPEKLLVLVIFNDPALLGFLFVGVMVLFEKNENTLEALAVTPITTPNYVLSKTIALTVISLFCCFAMVLTAYGTEFNSFHFAMATLLTTFIFSMLGFIAVAGQTNFNTYIMRALVIILLMSVPFLGYFEVSSPLWFVAFPTQPAIALYNLAFTKNILWQDVLLAYGGSLFWAFATFRWALASFSKYAIR